MVRNNFFNAVNFFDAVNHIDRGSRHSVVGQVRAHSLLYATMLNGGCAHSMDFDDTNIVGLGHPGAPVIAAALADATPQRRRGRRLQTHAALTAAGIDAAAK